MACLLSRCIERKDQIMHDFVFSFCIERHDRFVHVFRYASAEVKLRSEAAPKSWLSVSVWKRVERSNIETFLDDNKDRIDADPGSFQYFFIS